MKRSISRRSSQAMTALSALSAVALLLVQSEDPGFYQANGARVEREEGALEKGF
jgi:hypothetical protein